MGGPPPGGTSLRVVRRRDLLRASRPVAARQDAGRCAAGADLPSLPAGAGKDTSTLSSYDLAVIGVGIVGASAVYAATRVGARVVALDAGAPGAGTSGASFAWLNACRKEPEHYHRLNAAGMAAHRELARELGGDVAYHDGGSLEWAERDDKLAELRARVERLAG